MSKTDKFEWGRVGRGSFLAQISLFGVKMFSKCTYLIHDAIIIKITWTDSGYYSGLEVIKKFHAQPRLKFILLINVKMPTIWHFNIYEQDKLQFFCSKLEISIYVCYFLIYEQFKFYAQLS